MKTRGLEKTRERGRTGLAASGGPEGGGVEGPVGVEVLQGGGPGGTGGCPPSRCIESRMNFKKKNFFLKTTSSLRKSKKEVKIKNGLF